METQTKINAGYGLIMALLIGYVFIGPTDEFEMPIQEPTYKCVDRQVTYHCESLSKYYKLPNGKCINSVYGNKLCRSGWEEIPKVQQIEPEIIKLKSSSGIIHCTIKGCV